MKLIEISKSYRNGRKYLYLFVDDDYENEDIEVEVEHLCESDAAGTNYGYDYKWTIITDKEKIIEEAEKEIRRLTLNIFSLESKRTLLENLIKVSEN